ncbi:pseudaminic acid synthase [bacterium]|nr:pseudaminic acid synthase [bacterium]
MKTVKILDREVGAGCPAYLIAEMSCNHRQDYSIAKKTLRAIAASGADAVKLQTAKPETLTLDSDREEFVIKGGTLWDGRTLYDLYKETQTPWDWHEPLQKLATDLGLDFFSSPFDESAVGFLASLDIPVYKIASFEAVDPQLIKAAAGQGKPIIISTGIASDDDIEIALQACREVGNDQIILLKCTSAYPAPLEAANLRQIPALSERYEVPIGLSDHTESWIAPVGAVALGACVIEKHFILDRKLGGPDASFSLEPEEFKMMVQRVREVESAMGEAGLNSFNQGEQKARMYARSLFVVEDIAQGEPFTDKNVRSIRPGFGLPPKEYDQVIGRKAKFRLERGTPLQWDLID